MSDQTANYEPTPAAQAEPVVETTASGGYAAPANTVYLAAASAPAPVPPVKAMWICMAIAWVFFLLPIPLTALVAFPMSLAVVILAIICLFRNAPLHGAFGLVGSTIGSVLLYFVGLALMTLLLASTQ